MAVYTEVGDAELEAFLAEYDIGEADALKGVAEGVENSNYLLTTTKGQYFLTLYEKRVDPKDLPFFLGLMDHLVGARHQLSQADPRPRRQCRPHAGRQAGGHHHVPARPVAAPDRREALRADRARRSPSCISPAATLR